MMKKKILFLSIIGLCAITLSACWDKTEFTQVSFATAMAIDKENECYEVTVKLMLPEMTTESDQAQVWLVSGRGESIYDAIENLNNRSPREVYWGQMSLVILGKEVGEDITGALDYFSRARQFRRSEYIVCAPNKAVEFLTVSEKQSRVNAFYIYTLLHDREMRYKNSAVTLNDCFLWSHYQGGGAYLMPKLALAQPNSLNSAELGELDAKKVAVLDGAAVIKNNKIIDYLSEDEMEGYRYLKNNIKKGAIVIDNPLGSGKLSFNIEKSRTKLSWQDGVLKIKITGVVNLAEILSAKDIIGEKNSEKKMLEEKINQYISNQALLCVEKSIAQNADFLHLGQWMAAYQRKDFALLDGEDYLSRITVKIDSDFTFKLSAIAN